jgi:signal transduction histidine kinase
MRPDSHFVDDYMAAMEEERHMAGRDEWVQYQLAQNFIRGAWDTLRSAMVTIPLTFLLLYGHVSMPLLWLWLLMVCALLSYRVHIQFVFRRQDQQTLDQGQLLNVKAFFRRYGWAWPASGCLYALPVFLYFGVAPPDNQYLCLMILVGMGAISASLMAARVKIQHAFTHALIGTGMLAVLALWGMQWPRSPSQNSVIFMMLCVLAWVLLLRVGRIQHSIQRSSYEAQYDNEQLIQSLRQQTLAATEAVQVKNNLLASATHDLRQPVHALAFYADWLRNEPHLAESVVPKILAATDSVNTLFNSLFDFARIESGALQLRIDEVQVGPIIDELALQFAPAAQKKGLSLRTHPVQATVRSDPVLLRRILSNLVANAIRYSEKGGVLISGRVFGEKIWLEVWDSGVGIDAENLPHVFKEFYRAPGHVGTADSFGLGLAIVSRLCRALGHVITIRSQPGKGTRCRVEIDLLSGASTPASALPAP